MRRKTHLPSLAALALAALVTSACGGEEQEAASKGLVTQPQEQVESPKSQQLPGPARFIAAEIEALDGLTAAQRGELATLKTSVLKQSAKLRALHRQGRAIVAQQLRAGAFDSAALEAHVDKAYGAFEGQLRPLIASTLGELHRILDAEQRKQLVERLRARHRVHSRKHRKLAKLAETVGLSKEQQQQIRLALTGQLQRPEAVARRRAHRAKMKAIAEAFLRDDFDATRLPTGERDVPRLAEVRAKVAHFTTLAGKLLPILTETQREVLATLLER